MLEDLEKAVNNYIGDTYSAPEYQGVGHFIAAGINVFIAAALSISFIGLAYAFIKYVMSQGDFKEMAEAQRAATWGVVAAIVAITAVALKTVIYNAIGVTGEAAETNPSSLF